MHKYLHLATHTQIFKRCIDSFMRNKEANLLPPKVYNQHLVFLILYSIPSINTKCKKFPHRYRTISHQFPQTHISIQHQSPINP